MTKKHTAQDFWNSLDKSGECWIGPGKGNTQGYKIKQFGGKLWLSHRLAAHLSGMDIENKLVCHHCDNPGCCRPDHLFVGTQQDNMNDKVKKNRQHIPIPGVHYIPPPSPGEMNGRAILTEQQAIEIKYSGQSSKALSNKYNVSLSTIGHIKQNRSWKHI